MPDMNRFKMLLRANSRRFAVLSILSALLFPGYSTTKVSADGGGSPTPTFEAARSFATRPGGQGIVAGHFNHDGKLDLAVVDSEGVGVMFGDGAGNFGAPVWNEFQIGPKAAPVAADFNNDGHLDLAVTGGFANSFIHFFYGDGAGGFSGQYLAPPGEMQPHGLDAADLNKDGWIDIICGGVYGDPNSFVQFNLNGSFADALLFEGNGVTMRQTGLTTADFNKDGNPDIVITGGELGYVYLGDGAGNFSQTYRLENIDEIADAAAADINGDGHLDIITNPYLYFGDGMGGFTLGQQSPEFWPFELADVNLDGNFDLVVPSDQEIRVRQGDGVGGFGAATILATPVKVNNGVEFNGGGNGGNERWALVTTDFNGDGRPDIAALGDGAVNVLLNTTPLTPGAQAVAQTTTGPGSTVTTPDTSLTFPNVTMAGTTTVEPAPAAAANYSLSENLGSYEIETTAAYSTAGYYDASGNVADPTKGIKVTFDVPSVNDPSVFDALVVSHGEDTDGDGALEMVPYNGSADPLKVTHHDFATRTIWVYVPHLSPFVVVKGPADQIADLIALVQTYNLKQGISNSFDAKLENAQKALAAAKGTDRATACNQMGAFVAEAEAQSGKALTTAQAARLIGAAKGIRLLLGCK